MKKPIMRSSHAKPLEKKPDQSSIRRRQMEQILAVWEKFPHLRFTQLLVNATNQKELFYMNDETLVQRLTEYAKSFEKPAESLTNERNFPKECC